jgi:hypothetical protein
MHEAIVRQEPYEANIRLLPPKQQESLVAGGRVAHHNAFAPYSPMIPGGAGLDQNNLEAGPLGGVNPQYVQNSAVSLDMQVLNRRYQTLIDGLQVRCSPDVSSEVYTVLTKGTVINVQSLVVSPDSRCWAQVLLDPDYIDGPFIGYIPESTDSGNALLRPVGSSEVIQGGDEGIRPYGYDPSHVMPAFLYPGFDEGLSSVSDAASPQKYVEESQVHAEVSGSATVVGGNGDVSNTTQEEAASANAEARNS